MEKSFILTGPHWSELPTRGQIPSRPSIARNSSLLEAQLPPEQVPYLDAFLADDEPKDIAPRLGISAKAASARMRRFKAKLGVILLGPYAAD